MATKGEFKSIVPGSPSSSFTRRRPQPIEHVPFNGLRGSSSSPRGLKLLKENRTGIGSTNRITGTQSGSTPSSSPLLPSDLPASEADGTRTFLTSLTTSHANESHHTIDRPPSPLEAADTDVGDVKITREPEMADYVGYPSLQKFWHLFHREEAVNNHTLTNAIIPTSTTASILGNPVTGSPHPSRSNSTEVLGDRPRSARTTYLANIRRLHLTPEPLGIIRRRAMEKGPSSSIASTACASGTSVQEVNVSSYCMGNDYATAFSESVALVPGVEVLNVSNNRINDTVAARMITNILETPLLYTLQTLNLSSNGLRTQSVRALTELLKTSKVLTCLNLCHNQFKDTDLVLLCEALQKNQTLVRLHLSENRFGMSSMLAMAKFLEENSKIEEVYLAWNNIHGMGAFKMMEALKFHASLRAFDLSWNALDTIQDHPQTHLKPRAIVIALADALAHNKVLTHLDLSNNHLDVEDCTILSKALELNQTLIGLHMSGNCGIMDTRGFLIPKLIETKLMDQHKSYSIAAFEEAMNENGNGIFPSHLMPLVDRYCWYCGQWTEYHFVYPYESSHEIVSLHLSHDEWKGIEMEKREDGNAWSSYRVVPPGKTEYFFTILNTQTNEKTYHYLHDKRHTRIPHGQNTCFGTLTHVNYLRLRRRETRDPCNTIQPRAGKTQLGRTKWDINHSVFARRKRESVQHNFIDTDAFVTRACAADWRQCKVDRFIKDPIRRKEVETIVIKSFRLISSLYRKYCGHNALTSLNPSQSDIMTVPWSGYLEFLTDCNILDETSEYCRLADMENIFVAANLELTQEAKEMDNPDRSLTRFEFMEAVIRIAMNKYLKANLCETPAKAVEKLILDHLQPNAPEDPNEFRLRFLYTEEVSDVFAENIVLLQDVYSANMGRYCRPGEKKGMQLAEVLMIMERYQIYSDTFRVRDVREPYLACKLVVLDEMTTVGHKKLFLTDFMELLLRIAVLRYVPKPLTPSEVAKSLQKLFLNHFSTPDALLELEANQEEDDEDEQAKDVVLGCVDAFHQSRRFKNL